MVDHTLQLRTLEYPHLRKLFTSFWCLMAQMSGECQNLSQFYHGFQTSFLLWSLLFDSDSDSISYTDFGLPFYSNHLLPALYSCYLMKLLYNMILLPSDAHSDVINQHCRALPVLCRALIVLLLMISGNVHVHPGPSTVASPNSDLCSDICFTDFCSLPLSKSAVYEVRTSAVSATACHQWSTTRIDPRAHAVYNIAQAIGSSLIHVYADDSHAQLAPPQILGKPLNKAVLVSSKLSLPLTLFWTPPEQRTCGLERRMPLFSQVWLLPEGLELEVVTSYKYLGVWLDGTLSFSQHISKLQAKVKSRLGFLYRNHSSFTPAAKLTLIQMTIQPMLVYGDNAPYRTHHCTLYSTVNWSSVTHHKTHWLMLI